MGAPRNTLRVFNAGVSLCRLVCRRPQAAKPVLRRGSSRSALSSPRSFFADPVSVRAEFAAHHDGTALGTQQMLVVGVKLLKTVYNSKNHKK